ncbi:MAG TPA: hypothetical protein EYO33_13330 [Phycisphaerales bacterium]|nr:hypothetical protein [Phycisphaerales bacterium]
MIERSPKLYKTGDTVSHATHGIGTIKAIEEKEILGSTAVFATLYFENSEMKLTVLKKDLDEQVREILSEEEALEILNYLGSHDETLAQNWKTRNRKNKERLTSGDPRELCTVAKGLLMLKQKKNGMLSTADRNQLQKALNLLAEELARALDEDPQNMEDKLREVCMDSMAA